MSYKFINKHKDYPWIEDRTIYAAVHGSRAYGTHTPESDHDVKGIAIPPMEYFLGFNKTFEQALTLGPDITIFDIRKFFKLGIECNPNILEILYVEPSEQLVITKQAEKLIEIRDMFLSKKAKQTFCGYAQGQMKRISLHRRWLLSPETAPPKRSDYGLPEETVIPKDQLQAAQKKILDKMESWAIDLEPYDEGTKIQLQEELEKVYVELSVTKDDQWKAAGRLLNYSDNFLKLLDQERKYHVKMNNWHSYLNWKQNRNPQRAELEAKYGFDAKHAMHLVRLYRMGKEILETGKLLVKRPDAEELLSIRNGAWTYEQLMEYTEKMEGELEQAYQKSALPNAPDREKLDQICQEIILSMGDFQ